MSPLQKIARYVLLINGLAMFVFGVGVIVEPNLFTDNLEVYSGIRMTEVVLFNSRLATYIDRIVQLNGAFNILIGAVGMLAVWQSFRWKPRWLFWILILTNILGYLAPMTFDQITGVIRYPEVIEIIVFAFSLIAIIIIWPEFKSTHFKESSVY